MGLKERRAREREERKTQILDAARSLLFEKGLKATSVNQVAQRAELGVGTLYTYFASKEEIFAALQEEGLNLLHGKIDSHCRKEKTPRGKLRAVAAVYLDFSQAHRDYFDIINYFLAAPQILLNEALKQRVDRHGKKIIALIAAVIADGMEQNIFARGEPRKDAILFWGTLHGLMQFKKLEKTVLSGLPHGELFDYAVERLIDGLGTQPAVQ